MFVENAFLTVNRFTNIYTKDSSLQEIFHKNEFLAIHALKKTNVLNFLDDF